MSAYIVALMMVHDVETYRQYAVQVGPTLSEFGGHVLTANDAVGLLEGQQPYPRTVIVEFPTVDAARAWYESPAYRAVRPLRTAASNGTVFIVEGSALPDAPHGPRPAS